MDRETTFVGIADCIDDIYPGRLAVVIDRLRGNLTWRIREGEK